MVFFFFSPFPLFSMELDMIMKGRSECYISALLVRHVRVPLFFSLFLFLHPDNAHFYIAMNLKEGRRIQGYNPFFSASVSSFSPCPPLFFLSFLGKFMERDKVSSFFPLSPFSFLSFLPPGSGRRVAKDERGRRSLLFSFSFFCGFFRTLRCADAKERNKKHLTDHAASFSLFLVLYLFPL